MIMSKKEITFYCILQYVPYPIANERINIEVLVFNDRDIKFQALKNWKRVHNFGKENLDFLYDFVERMHEWNKKGLLFPGDDKLHLSRMERMRELSNSWMNSIQFTQPHPSLASIDKLLMDIVEDFLIEPKDKSNN